MLVSMIRACCVAAIVVANVTAASAVNVPAPSGQVGVPYQRELSKSCAGLAFCSLDFPVVAAKRRVDLSLVNSATLGTGGLQAMSLDLLEGSTPLIHHELIQAQTITSGGQVRRLFSDPVAMSAAAGRHFRVTVALSSGEAGLRCSLFGTLVILP